MLFMLEEYTGEEALHPWMDSRRIKQTVLSLQAEANKHRLTVKYDETDKEHIFRMNSEYSEIMVCS